MNIVFLGASTLGMQCCRQIVEKNLAKVCGIFTIPKNFNISYSDTPVENVNYADFHELGREFNIPVTEVTGKMNDYYDNIKELNPDLIVVIGWYYKIPKSILKIAPKGCVGMHSSLLPKYRGGAPLVWSVINGESKTGLTFFYLDSGIDNGDIIAQNEIEINSNDNINDLLVKVKISAINIITQYIPLIAKNKAPRIKQDETLATYFPQRKPEDGLIDWNWDAKKIKDFIRAQTKPYPGAYTIINGKKITLWDAEVKEI
ncbi:MAG: methionyl-tRNA formyltransferase [Ignavibacteria bacterium]|nr:methionyl-tRNA formyltransferase [Ignavibacteria bacterium]